MWSTDWFRNPGFELKRLIETIENAKTLQQVHDEEYEEESFAAMPIEREVARAQEMEIPGYELATVPADIADLEIHQHSIGRLAIWIEEIVKVENPVHFDEVARRMIEAADITRVGSRIREALMKAVKYAEGNKWIRVSEDFLWHREMKEPRLRDRSNLPPAAKKLKYIAPEEMILAIEKVVRSAIAIQPEAVVPIVTRIFGFARVTEDMKAEIRIMINRAIQQKNIILNGSLLKINN